MSAAVAELVEAAEAFTTYVAAEHGDKSILDQDAMWDRLAAALARVKGGEA